MTDRLLWTLLLLGALLVAAGCTRPIDAAAITANTAAAALRATESALAAAYRQAQRDAAARVGGDRADATVRAEVRDRVDAERARWALAWEAYDAAYSSWAITVAAIHAARQAEDAGFAPDVAGLAVLLSDLAESVRLLGEHAARMGVAP
jgi:hypothetical protein